VTVYIVCGSTGAGKTSYALELAARERGVRFSIDPWMQTLFAPDRVEIEFSWMIERIARCEEQIWQVAAQLIPLGIPVILDLGFTTHEHRLRHAQRARQAGAVPAVHFLDVPADVRRQRVAQRNRERDPAVFALEVTEAMFDFMEGRFEPPDPAELEGGLRLSPP
jgi:predicted kinase